MYTKKNIRMIYMRGLDLKIWNIKSWLQIRTYWMRLFLVKTYHMLEIRTRFNEISILLTRFLIKPRRLCLVCPITGRYWTLWLTVLGYWTKKIISHQAEKTLFSMSDHWWILAIVISSTWILEKENHFLDWKWRKNDKGMRRKNMRYRNQRRRLIYIMA